MVTAEKIQEWITLEGMLTCSNLMMWNNVITPLINSVGGTEMLHPVLGSIGMNDFVMKVFPDFCIIVTSPRDFNELSGVTVMMKTENQPCRILVRSSIIVDQLIHDKMLYSEVQDIVKQVCCAKALVTQRGAKMHVTLISGDLNLKLVSEITEHSKERK